MLRSVLERRSALYAAGPLTSGRRFYEGDRYDRAVELRKQNDSALAEFVRQLRAKRSEPVLDPGPLRVAGWTGEHYGSFFLEVIDEFAKELHLLDGWEFSRGATKEFIFCVNIGIPAFAASGAVLDSQAGKRLVQRAVGQLDELGVDPDHLRRRLEQFGD